MVNITIHFSNGSHLDFSLLKSKLQYILARSIILLAEIAIFLSSWINPNLNCYKQNSKSDEILVSAPTYIHAKQVCPSCDWWVYWVYSKAVCSLLGLQQSCLQSTGSTAKLSAVYWVYSKAVCTTSIGRFSEAGLHKWMPFIIFHARSRERSQCHFRADLWVGAASRCV